MKHQNILHVYRTYFPDPPGGLQEAIRQISLSTQKHGMTNRIFSLSPSPAPHLIDRDEGTVIRSRSYIAPSSCDLGGLAAFRQFAEMTDWADIIHYHFPWPFADLLHFATRCSKPRIMTYHSDIIGKRYLAAAYKPLMMKMLASMDMVVATSKAYAKSSITLQNIVPAERQCIIPLGIDETSYAAFNDSAKKIRLTEQFNLQAGQYFLFVGVLRSYKGLSNLVKAARQTGLPVVIAGSGPEGEKLEKQASGAANIHLLGQVSNAEKMALISGCRAAVLPSNMRSEAFGVYLVEASMMAKPMISCEISTGSSYVNKDQTTGIVVPPDDIDALANAIKTLWQNVELATSYGQAARKRYKRLFSEEAQGRAYANLYRSIARKKSLAPNKQQS